MSRKQYTIHYIYKTTCLVNSKFYIGMHSTFNLDDNYLGSGKKLRYFIRKYGIENHKKEILEFCDTIEHLRKREYEIIKEYLKDPLCINMVVGGWGGFWSTEQQKHRSQCGGKAIKEKFKNDKEFFSRMSKLFSERAKKLHKKGKLKYYDWTGRKHRPETIEKIKATMKERNHQRGENNSQFGKYWIYNPILKEHKQIVKLDSIPEGWYKGKKIKEFKPNI